MLELSEKEAAAWRKKAEADCVYTRTLSLSLEEATELPVSDANGKADPYCKFVLVSRAAVDRNPKGKMADLAPKGTSVQMSRIQPRTLDPVWKELFEFELRGEELLLLEAWDSDAEDEKLGVKSGFKGFKAKLKDNLSPGQDDFLGRCFVELSDFSTSTPQSTWFDLRSHTKKSYRGKVHLTIHTQTCLTNSLLSVYKKGRYGDELMELFLLEAARYCTQFNKPFVDGKLPQPFFSIANSIQTLLSMDNFQATIARIPFLAKYVTKYTYVRDELCMSTLVLSSIWQEEIERIPMRCVQEIISHFYSVYQHELQLLERISNVFPNNCARSLSHLASVLKSITKVFEFLKFTRRLQEDLSLSEVLKERILRDIDTWKQREFVKAQPLSPSNPDLDQAATLSDVCYAAAQYLANSWVGYQKTFKKAGLNYIDLVFSRLDELLAMEIKEFFEKSDVSQLFTLGSREGKALDKELADKSKGALVIFRLYQAVRDVLNFSSYTKTKPEDGWCLEKVYTWFKPCVLTWMEITKSIASASLGRVIQFDSGQVYDKYNNIKVTSSAVDTSICFEQCYQFYERLQWPVNEDTFNFMIKLTLVGGDIAKCFAQLLSKKLETTIREGIESKLKFTIDEHVCLLLNNVHVTKHHLEEIPSRLDWKSLDKDFRGEGQSPTNTLQRVLDGAIEDVKNSEYKMLITLGECFEREFRKSYHSCLTQPYDFDFDCAMDPLMVWMVENVQGACDTLCTDHFSVLLKELWSRVIKILIEYKDNKTRTEGQYKRLYLSLEVLYQFFHGNGDGLGEENLHSFEFEILQNYFRLYSLGTTDLIHKYYRELARANKNISEKFGNLTFSVYYQTENNHLSISIIRGENFPRLDSFLGTCDPYITVNLLPELGEFKTLKTRHHKRALSALFNEEFSVHIPLETLQSKSKVVQLSLWDHDRISQDEYAGSIYLDISEIPIIYNLISETEGRAKPVSRNFMFPIDHPILQVLNDRTVDRDSILFLKFIRNLISARSKIPQSN